MNFSGFETNKEFDYENGFYLTSNTSRLGKVLTHYELYKMIINLPGDIVEFGVFKGSSLIKWATFRELFENTESRKVIGFDIFGKFPETNFESDMQHREEFMKDAGEMGISIEELYQVFEYKGLKNIDLDKG